MANLKKIRDFMDEKGITYDALAGMTGLSPSGIVKMIRKNCGMSDSLELIANALGVSVCEFFKEGNDSVDELPENITIPKEVLEMLRKKDERITELTNALIEKH